MKEAYFTTQTLRYQARQICEGLDQNRRKRRERFMPRSSALLVLDMQDYFLTPSSHAFIPSASVILPGLRLLIETYAELDLPVIFTRHMNTPQDAGCMADWWRELLSEANPLSALTAELDRTHGVTLVKTQYDAFYNTPLADLLDRQRARQVVISGVMTHLCCETTARSAFVRGFEVFFTVDGTAADTEAHHRAALLNLSHGFAAPVLVEEILSACQEVRRERV